MIFTEKIKLMKTTGSYTCPSPKLPFPRRAPMLRLEQWDLLSLFVFK